MLDFLYTAVSWVLLRWHDLFSLVFDEGSGVTWSLSVVFLVVTARLLLFRFFIKQVHYQRKMQEMQPRLTAMRSKYKDDKQGLQREMMRLQQEEGFNPVAGCLPMLLQIPVFIGLFHVMKHIANSAGRLSGDPLLRIYTFTEDQTLSAAHAKLFGAPLSSSLLVSQSKLDRLGGDLTTVRIVTVVLVVISAAATFITQRMVMRAATVAPTGTSASIQKVMLYFIPLGVLFSGVAFPLGVLLYWFTSNLWTMGQQFYILRYHPHPGGAVAPVDTERAKSLAPKPGAKPANLDKRRTVSMAKDQAPVESADGLDNPPARPASPRPGTRPQRPGGNRPAAKRPSKAKKRR